MWWIVASNYPHGEKYVWRVEWCRSMRLVRQTIHNYDNGTESDNQIINYAYNGGMVVNM